MHGCTPTQAAPMTDSTAHAEITVDVPLRVAYNQWTQFETYPEFMGGVEEARQEADDTVFFRVVLAGHTVEYTAKILHQIPDRRIEWQSVGGDQTGGVVTFAANGPDKTDITLNLTYAPHGVLEKLADLLGVVSRRTHLDLANFKKYIEERGYETGGWRGALPAAPTH